MARRPMGELEAAVMDLLWDRGGWATAGDVHQGLANDTDSRQLAYTTVLTVLSRLWQKERLERRRDGRAHVYRPVNSREEDMATRMGELLAGARDRPLALSHFVGELSEDDRAELQRMLASEAGFPGGDTIQTEPQGD